LSQLWAKAGGAIAPYDLELAQLAYVKGHGWADSEVWAKPEFRDLPTNLDEMLQKVLESTRKASESGREVPTNSTESVVEGILQVDTLTWRTTVLLPPFAAAPRITLARPQGGAIREPEIKSVTPDLFTITINNSEQAGEWVWRARGVLLRTTTQDNPGSQVAHGTGIAQADRGSTAHVTVVRKDK
jgi:hypothetical protein